MGNNTSADKGPEDNGLQYVAIFLGFLCFILLGIIIWISVKRTKGCICLFCFRRRDAGNSTSANVVTLNRTTVRSPPPQTSQLQEQNFPVYATIDTKKKKETAKKNSFGLDLISPKNPQATYSGADGTEYMMMMGTGSTLQSTGQKPVKPATAPPMQQQRLFETSTYASIDHELNPCGQKVEYK